MNSKLWRLVVPLMVGLLTAACAPLTAPPKAEYPVGRARLVLPAGAWQDLGVAEQGEGRAVFQTRSVGLRGAQGEWLAVLRVRTNRTGQLGAAAQWSHECPRQQEMTVEDAAAGSPVRADCLQFKRWGNSNGWLEKNRPDWALWLGQRDIVLKQPFAYLSYRYATEAGILVWVETLVDHRLITPKTHNNEEFLAAGRPALQWGRDLAQATRVSVGMADGALAIPPFPFPIPPSRP